MIVLFSIIIKNTSKIFSRKFIYPIHNESARIREPATPHSKQTQSDWCFEFYIKLDNEFSKYFFINTYKDIERINMKTC